MRAVVEVWRPGVLAEEIFNRLPHLTSAQVFDALCCYSDHQAKINAYIACNRILDALTEPLVRER